MNKAIAYDEKEYKIACTEMLEILKYIPEVDLKKIPSDIIKVLKEHYDSTYNFKLNLDESLKKQNISELTKAIIANFYRDYWVTDVERKKILKEEETVRRKVAEEKSQSFDSKDIFKQNTLVINRKENRSLDLVKIKEKSFLQNIFKRLKKFFNK